MSFSINPRDNIIRAQVSNSTLTLLGFTPEQLEAPEVYGYHSKIFPGLTLDQLENFSFSLEGVIEAFNLADTFQSFRGQGNQQLTQQEIRFFLEKQSSLPNVPEKESNFL